MAINNQLRMLHNGRPVRPGVNLRLTNDVQRKAVSRSDVRSAKELFLKNAQVAKSTPIEIGANSTKIMRQVRSGKVNILA
ncbi:hypothetical protein ACFL6G_04295 [candidate division KSB1 bacterium]